MGTRPDQLDHQPAHHCGRQRVWRRGERGASSVAEVVLIAPTLLFAIMLVFQFGLLFHARNIAEQAAQDGAAAARRFDGTAVDAQAETRQTLTVLGTQTLRERSVKVNRTADSAEVTVSGTVIAVVPGLHLAISESASGPVERYVAPVVTP